MNASCESSTPQTLTVIPALAFTAMAGTMSMMSFVAVIGPVSRTLGLAEWHAGLSITAAGVLWMLLARRWGAWSDLVGRRRVLLIALAACAAFYLALAMFVDLAVRQPPAILISVLALVLLRGAIGAFHSALPPTTAAIVADRTQPGNRAAAMAKLGTANASGMLLGPAAAGWLATQHLAWPLYAAALLPLLAWGLLWWLLPVPTVSDQSSAGSRPPVNLKLFDSRLRIPALVAFVGMMSVSIAQVSVGFFAIDRLNLTPENGAKVAGLALTAVGVGLISAQTLLMRFKGVQPINWIRLGTVLSAIGFSCVSLITAQEQLLMCYGLAAFGMGFTLPSMQALSADAVTAQEQGVAAGTISSMQGLGMIAGPILGTLLYRITPAAPYLFIGTLLLTLAVVTATVVTATVRKSHS